MALISNKKILCVLIFSQNLDFMVYMLKQLPSPNSKLLYVTMYGSNKLSNAKYVASYSTLNSATAKKKWGYYSLSVNKYFPMSSPSTLPPNVAEAHKLILRTGDPGSEDLLYYCPFQM